MADQIIISKTLSIRDCGYDENWLQEQIAANPSILDLGDLEVVHREKKQSSGGRLDFLLQDSKDNSMFEVELMLGPNPNGDDSDWQVIRLKVDQDFFQENGDLFQEFAKLYQQSCQRT